MAQSELFVELIALGGDSLQLGARFGQQAQRFLAAGAERGHFCLQRGELVLRLLAPQPSVCELLRIAFLEHLDLEVQPVDRFAQRRGVLPFFGECALEPLDGRVALVGGWRRGALALGRGISIVATLVAHEGRTSVRSVKRSRNGLARP